VWQKAGLFRRINIVRMRNDGGAVIFVLPFIVSGPGSSVGTATGYGMDGPGIEFRWRRDFPHLSRPALGPTQPRVQRIGALSLR